MNQDSQRSHRRARESSKRKKKFHAWRSHCLVSVRDRVGGAHMRVYGSPSVRPADSRARWPSRHAADGLQPMSVRLGEQRGSRYPWAVTGRPMPHMAQPSCGSRQAGVHGHAGRPTGGTAGGRGRGALGRTSAASALLPPGRSRRMARGRGRLCAAGEGDPSKRTAA